MKKKLIMLLSIMIIVIVVTVAFTKLSNQDTKKEAGKLTIVTSFYPIYVAAENVVSGIEDVELINLSENQTGCLHDYQLTTKDMKKFEKADIFIINGGGIDDFAEEIVAAYPHVKVIDSSVGIDFLQSEEHSHQDVVEEEENVIINKEDESKESSNKEEANSSDTHEEGSHKLENNPHVWLDPSNYLVQIENIKDGLAKYNSANTKRYEENAAIYQEKIEQVDKELISELKEFDNKDIVIFHDSFAYLAKKLGLNVIHTVNMDSDTSLSAGEIAEVIDEVKENKVEVLFSEMQYSDDIPTNIANETDAKVYVIDSLVTNSGDMDSYIIGMENNIEILKEALYQ